ncbi:MAG: DUF1801 domain-containing protein [Ferruginibacter sp.]
MISKKTKPASIEEYIDFAPEETRVLLRQMHTCIQTAAPGAKESLKWGMPAYSYHRILVTFAVFRHHIGFYPTPPAVEAFAKELTNYNTAKGSVRFPLNQPLPLPLIRKITLFRVRECLDGDIKWRT